MKYSIEKFGSYNKVEYDEIFIEKEGKFKISFSDLGARINSWSIYCGGKKFESIVLGFKDASEVFDYPSYYFGAIVGRVAGRVKDARFFLSDKEYLLPKNDGKNHIHGGNCSFDKRKWDYEIVDRQGEIDVIFTLEDKDGSNGYPGNLNVKVKYTVNQDNECTITYEADTDKTTIFNPTNHVYFNLNGDNKKDIKNHRILINADQFLPVDGENLPLGMAKKVDETPFDLRQGPIFESILGSKNVQFSKHNGFDHPFILNKNIDFDGYLSVEKLNRKLYFKTTEPVVVIYTLNKVSDNLKIWGNPLGAYSGVTLETQKEPNAINQENFSNTILESGQKYVSKTKYWIES